MGVGGSKLHLRYNGLTFIVFKETEVLPLHLVSIHQFELKLNAKKMFKIIVVILALSVLVQSVSCLFIKVNFN